MRLWPAFLLALGAGCYNPTPERACHVLCGPAGESSLPQCPQGLACNAGTCTALDGTCPIEPDAGPRSVIDGPPSTTDAPEPGNCYGHQFQICFAAPPTGTPPEYDGSISTNMDSTDCTVMLTSTQDMVCVISGETIMIGTIRATGTYPLVVVAAKAIVVNGVVDVSAQGGTSGAGWPAPNGTCPPGTEAQGQSGAAAGGAGGSFGTAGGVGGNASSAEGGTPGAAVGTPKSSRAGCDGEPGGGTGNANYGFGGGAVYLIAGETIGVGAGAAINASGGGAPISGGNTLSIIGGGGGGSGGLIGLDAMTINNHGNVLANGGGGAAGTQDTSGAGDSPNASTPSVAARGGQSDISNANGGEGAVATATGGMGLANTSGPAGGGGGGVGYILVNGSVSGADGVFSPPPTSVP